MVERLVERIRQKDQKAMSQLYQMYVEELSSVCYRYVPDEEDVKDVLQNSYRTVLNLYVFEGYSHKEIAKLMGIKESTSPALEFGLRLHLSK